MKPLYLDFEDDLTAVISKIAKSEETDMLLVIPKRSTLFHSVVNMKLLLKNAKENEKRLSFVTQDPKIVALAAHLHIPVAPDVKSDPVVPEVAELTDSPTDENVDTELTSETAAQEPVPPVRAAAVPSKGRGALRETARKFKIPDFDRFKKHLVLGLLGVVLLISLGWLMTSKLPKAEIVLRAQINNTSAALAFTADTKAKAVDQDKAVVPAISHEVNKTLAQTFKPTGQKDIGKKATGQMDVVNNTGSERSFPAGTKFTANGKTFVSDSAFTVPRAVVDPDYPGVVLEGKETVAVTAEKAGDSYNLAPTTYTIEGQDSSKVYGDGGQMSGGTTQIATVVSQGDIDKVKSELLDKERDKAKQELAARFDDDEKPIEASFTEKVNEVSSTPALDQPAEEGRLTVKVTYYEFGVRKDDLTALVKHRVEQIDRDPEEPSTVLEVDLDGASYRAKEQPNPTTFVFEGQFPVVLGPDLDLEKVKRDVAGQGYSKTLDEVKALPQVIEAEVNLSPFWVFKVPKDTAKISIRVELPR